ncbi:MAG: SDR family oxidoreductase [Gammaproteobacteria bacterium]|nr:MAG: SDR family oxidoreductase [Gammaproteobacteria bacterium]
MDQQIDVVTGGAGFIGSHLVDKLLSQGRSVRVIDSLVTGHPRNLQQHQDNPNLEFIQGDITNTVLMNQACQQAERVFHVAARADIVPSIEDPTEYFKSNVEGTLSVLEAARLHRVKRLVYIASSSCYGFPDVFPTPETAKISPQYPYALTKYLGEEMVLHWHKVYKMPVASVRCFNVYGPRARTSGSYGAVFGVFLAQLLAGKPLTIVGDGQQVRDFVYVSDVVEAIIAAANSSVSGEVFNIGSGQKPVSVNRLVELLGAKETTHIPKRPGEPDMTWADVTKIQSILKWQAKVSIEEGVKIMLDNMHYWQTAPVWTPESIADATKVWFKYLESPSV